MKVSLTKILAQFLSPTLLLRGATYKLIICVWFLTNFYYLRLCEPMLA